MLQANLFRAVEQSGLFAVDPELQASDNATGPRALGRHYALLVKVARVVGAAVVSRGSHNVLQGRRFLTEHRMLVMHVLKRSAGIGVGIGGGAAGDADAAALLERIDDLAEAFMVIITATGFLEVSRELPAQPNLTRPNPNQDTDTKTTLSLYSTHLHLVT